MVTDVGSGGSVAETVVPIAGAGLRSIDFDGTRALVVLAMDDGSARTVLVDAEGTTTEIAGGRWASFWAGLD